MAWLIALEILGLIGGTATFIALFLSPMFYLGSKIETMRKQMAEESKDFHGRLISIEERIKK